MTMQPQHGLAAHGQVQVARLLLANGLKQFVDEQCTHCPASASALTSMEPVMPTPKSKISGA